MFTYVNSHGAQSPTTAGAAYFAALPRASGSHHSAANSGATSEYAVPALRPALTLSFVGQAPTGRAMGVLDPLLPDGSRGGRGC